jgi:phenylalanyl-tRNA synthetase beta chain
MKVTLNWLKQYVDFDWSPEQLAERLTMLGLEVESVTKVTGEFEGIVVAQILTKDKVPGSDKLSVCKVNDGKGERTIICGAQNHNVGDKVPLILPNFALPLKAGEKEPFVIKERKVFGITSQGMMCSPQELGLPDQVDGLLILPTDAPIGKPFAEYLGRSAGDVVYDLEITPNRPDWNSVIGIAREISAVTGHALKMPTIQFLNTSSEPISGVVWVRMDEPEFCPRYTARVVRNVKVRPSPDWLRSALEKVGVRSINNIVDVTNFVMLETGQPLHAFDYHLLTRASDTTAPTIVVRRAGDGEKFITLDGQERTLTREMLLIADELKGIALAGIMGGQNTEIHDDTKDVLIESAYFDPANIRHTSKALGLRSESSYRFERGSDVEICDWASRRAAQLISDLAGGEVLGHSIDTYPKPPSAKTITLRHDKVTQLLGLELKPEEIEYYLAQLGLKITGRKARPVDAESKSEPATFVIPSFRVDLKGEVDLIEEVARLHGVDKIPSTPPRGAIGSNAFDGVYDEIEEVRRLLSGSGLNEACGQTLIADTAAKLVTGAVVPLANPLSSDMNVLRPSLLPGLLDSLRHNVTRKNYDVGLFEIGRVFQERASGVSPGKGAGQKGGAQTSHAAPRQDAGGTFEERRVAIALTGQRHATFWSGSERDAKCDASDLKGVVEELLEQFGIRGVSYSRRAEPTALFIESATIMLGGKLILGEMGQVSPLLAKKYDLRDAVFLAELRLDELLARRNATKSFKTLPQFPSIRRDIAMLVPEATTHDAVLGAVKQAKAGNLEGVELFDVFRGKNVPAGQKSMAYAFTYRSAEKTLTDAEVNAAHENIVEQLKRSVNATMRE